MFSCWQGSRANDRFLLLAREQTAVSGLLVHRVTRAKEKEREREGRRAQREKRKAKNSKDKGGNNERSHGRGVKRACAPSRRFLKRDDGPTFGRRNLEYSFVREIRGAFFVFDMRRFRIRS